MKKLLLLTILLTSCGNENDAHYKAQVVKCLTLEGGTCIQAEEVVEEVYEDEDEGCGGDLDCCQKFGNCDEAVY